MCQLAVPARKSARSSWRHLQVEVADEGAEVFRESRRSTCDRVYEMRGTDSLATEDHDHDDSHKAIADDLYPLHSDPFNSVLNP